MALPEAKTTVSQAAIHHDLEKAIPAEETDKKLKCRPTISAIDIHSDRPAQRYPRSLRKNEDKYVASLPPLAPRCTRIYLREEDCQARDAFAVQGTFVPEIIKQLLQLVQSAQRKLGLFGPDPTFGLIESTIDRVLESSGVDRWWSVHKADRFDVWDLRNLFNHQDHASQRFLVQLNVEASQAHKHAILAPAEDTGVIEKRLHAGRFKSDTVFWEKYAVLETCRLEAENAFEVHCWFPALSYVQLPEKLSDEYVFPLLIQFEQLLCSVDSSILSSIGDPSMIQPYIVLDYLRCVTLSWLDFLKRVNHASSSPSRVLTQAEHDNDNHVTAAMQNTVDDLKACVLYILDRTTVLHDSALAEPSVSKISNERSSRKHLLMIQDLRTQLEYLSKRSASLRERSERLFELGNAATSNSQAQSAGRLTVVASIFLPLTLAASLLAMNVPAASIGRLWYDFVGMCVCIAFICFACYSAYRKLQNLRQSDSIIGAWHSFKLATSTRSDPAFKATGVLLLWGFLAVIAASFLAGMFKSFHVALDALKYGLPILFCIVVLYWVVSSMIYILPTLQDVLTTVWFTMKIQFEIQERDASTTITETPNPVVSGSSNPAAEQNNDATIMPSLNKRVYNAGMRELLVSTAEAFQNVMADRPADPEKLMVGLVQQLLQELDEFDQLADKLNKLDK